VASRNHGEYAVLSALLLGQLIGPLDAAMVNVALPSIAEDLNLSITASGWILIIYFLFAASFMISFGRLGDVVGRKKIFRYGLLVFSIGSVSSGLSAGYAMLLAARAVQAIGAGMFTATLPALITSTFPEEERGKALGIATTVVSIGLAIGPFLGGAISGTLGWRYVFLIAPVFAMASFFLCRRLVPESRASREEEMDFYGAFLILAILAPATLALSQGRIWGWGTPVIIGLFALSIAAAWLFIRHERATAFSIIDLELFRIPTFTLSNLASYASYIAFQAALFVTPFFLQYYMGMSPQTMGLVIAVTNTTSLFLLSPSGILSDRISPLPLEITGMAFIALSMSLFALAGADLTLTIIVVSLVALGIGYGVFRSSNYSAVMGSVPEPSLGVAGGVFGTMRTMGFLTGIAMAGTVMGEWATKRPVAEGAGAVLNNPAFEAAARNAYLAALIVALVGLLFLFIKLAYRES
jgi:MFS family permease